MVDAMPFFLHLFSSSPMSKDKGRPRNFCAERARRDLSGDVLYTCIPSNVHI